MDGQEKTVFNSLVPAINELYKLSEYYGYAFTTINNNDGCIVLVDKDNKQQVVVVVGNSLFIDYLKEKHSVIYEIVINLDNFNLEEEQSKDDICIIDKKLKNALENEDYELAAQLRDLLNNKKK
jgi:hypothetical protein